VRNANASLHVLQPLVGSEAPTLGTIKRALHELSRTASGSAQGSVAADLREAHALLRRLAHRNGINPDDALQLRRAAVESQREHLVRASISASQEASR
jgi:cobalamin biosynthesis protein CobD/CbiB